MSAAALLASLGRPEGLRLGATLLCPTRTGHLPTGLAGLDAALGGGLPRGRLTELAGPPSTGRTGLACLLAAAATAAGEVIAWIDAEDALDPAGAAGGGVVLERTLWVRPRAVLDALQAAELLAGAGGFGLVVLDLGTQTIRPDTRAWPRLVRAVERTDTILLATATRRLAGPHAALAIELAGRRTRWSDAAGRLRLLDGFEARVTVARSRVGRPGGTVLLRHTA